MKKTYETKGTEDKTIKKKFCIRRERKIWLQKRPASKRKYLNERNTKKNVVGIAIKKKHQK